MTGRQLGAGSALPKLAAFLAPEKEQNQRGWRVPCKDAGVPAPSLLLSLGLLGLAVDGRLCAADPLLEASCFARQA